MIKPKKSIWDADKNRINADKDRQKRISEIVNGLTPYGEDSFHSTGRFFLRKSAFICVQLPFLG
jgi:hypothetical protein